MANAIIKNNSTTSQISINFQDKQLEDFTLSAGGKKVLFLSDAVRQDIADGELSKLIKAKRIIAIVPPSSVNANASQIKNDSSIVGENVKDVLELITNPFKNPIPENGSVFPLSTSRAYYQALLYSPTPIFKVSSTGITRKYVAYYGNGTNNFVAYSDNGYTWDTETIVTGVLPGYHSEVVLVGNVIHLFYWDTAASIYSPASVRHATIDATTNCSIATADAPLTGNYITGVYANGLRYGTYGIYQAFYNASPTNDILNPYSYRWCIMHNGTDGNNEGILFATSTDGYNFSAWNSNNEVISRGTAQWDSWIGTPTVWKIGNDWFMYYAGGKGTTLGSDSNFADGLGFATSTDGITWTKNVNNPILFKTYSFKTAKRLYCPRILKEDSGWRLYVTMKSQAGEYKVGKIIINKLS